MHDAKVVHKFKKGKQKADIDFFYVIFLHYFVRKGELKFMKVTEWPRWKLIFKKVFCDKFYVKFNIVAHFTHSYVL